MFEHTLTLKDVNEFKQLLNSSLEQSSQAIEIDLRHIEEIDTAGVQFLVALDKELNKQNRAFDLLGINSTVTGLLGLLGLENILQSGGIHE